MPKFLITPQSHNRLTGPIMVTTSPRRTCPGACPLKRDAADARGGSCYAEHGFLGGFIWGKLDQLPVGGHFKSGQIRVHSLKNLTDTIRQLPPGTMWRHNQAGDLFSHDQTTIAAPELRQIVEANSGRSGFTYTHYDVLENRTNRQLVKAANDAGFTVNLSGNDLAHADKLAALDVAPVTTLLPAGTKQNFTTAQGRKVVICPARTTPDMNCAKCGICAKQRNGIIGFPAIGKGADKIV